MENNSTTQDLRILERLQNISPNTEVAETLKQLGYHSAHQIALGRPSEFTATTAAKLEGLVAGKSGAQVAQAVYAAAQHVRNRVWSLALAPQLDVQPSTDVSSKLQQPDFQEGLPNYERIFGPMLSCDCEECMSIYSPGAYFVDLMNVVAEYITAPSAASVPTEFALQYRRPDLWNLLIDCKNANTEVGYLEIVNAVMLQNLSTNYLDGGAPVEYIASANYPFSAPYNQPLQETRAALAQLGSALPAIYKALKVVPPAAAQAMLNLSPEQYALIVSATTAMPSLATLYGFHDTSADVAAALTYQQLFLARTGMEPLELEAMVYQNLRQPAPNVDSEVVSGIVNTLFLNNILGSGAYISLQNQDLLLQNAAEIGITGTSGFGELTSVALYQIAQMKRLQEQTGWAWADLDWALKSVAGTSQTITQSMIEYLGQLAEIVDRYDIALDEACAFWYDMKTYGRGNDALPQDLWDRVWNTPPLMTNDQSGTQPPYYRPVYASNPLFTSPVITLDLANTGTSDTMLMAGTAAALGVNGVDFQALLHFLTQRQTLAASTKSPGFTVQNMSILYRYARLAKMLGRSLQEFVELVDLMQLAVPIWTVQQVMEICNNSDWLRQANITVAQLGYLLTGNLPVGARPVLNAQQIQQAVNTVVQASAQVRVTADSFVTATLPKSMAETIFAQLVTDGFIDDSGLVLSEVALTIKNVYGSLATGLSSSEAVFAANPNRQIAQLSNTGSSSCGTIQLGYDPFADATIQADNNFTISFWMNSAQVLTQTWPGFVGWKQGTNNNNLSPNVTQQESEHGTLIFAYSPQAGGQRVAIWLHNFIEKDNEWIFVTWVVQAGEWQIYRNGELFPGVNVTMATPPYLQQSGEGLTVGYFIGNILNGAVANLGIWNIALDAPAIRALMFTEPAAGTAGLIGYWPIDEGTDTVIYDRSGAATVHNGTLQGSYAWQTISHLPAKENCDFVLQTLINARDSQNALVFNGLAGRLGVSAEVMAAACDLTGNEVPLYSYPDFDGAANYVAVAYAEVLNNATFSVAFFMMPTGDPDTVRNLVSSLDYSTTGVTKGYQLSLNAQNQVVFTTGSGGSEFNTLTSEVSIRANVWTSIVATYDGKTMKLAINSRNYYQFATTAFAPNATEALYIAVGLNSSEVLSGFFKGHIVQVMVANTAVSKHTFMVDYKKLRNGTTTIPTYLMGWWQLNQQPLDAVVTDASGNAHNGTLEGSIVYTAFPANELLRLRIDDTALPTDTLATDIAQALDAKDAQRPAYLRKLQENVQLAKLTRLNAAEINALQSQAAVFGTDFSFRNTNISLPQLHTLSKFKAMVKAFGDTTNQLLSYFGLALGNIGTEAATSEQLQALLSRITGWSQQDLSKLMGYFGLTKVSSVGNLWQISEVMAIASKTGISIDGLFLMGKLPSQNLVSPATDADPWQTYLAAAQVAQSAVRAQGKEVTTSPNPQTQKQLRDRLAAWLIWELNATVRGIRNQQDLYEYLLIDVKMSPDVQTSYLVSAMNSLQLYVNRCYNNLEPGVVNEVPAKWWEWMSTYRVWQANREVYLYPENYVDPSLRKFASPQFKTLLNAISKGQINDANVTQAYAQYLEGIKDLADLVLVDAYAVEVPQTLPGTNPDNTATITYIAGRTQAHPPKYYVRKLLTITAVADVTTTSSAAANSNVQFGPWEEIGLTINSDYVTLAHAYGKLFVFWVQQTSKTFTNSQNNQCQAVYATIYYSYQSLAGNWVAPLTLKNEIPIGFDQVSLADLKEFASASSIDFELFTDFGIYSAYRIVPYLREKIWNKVTVLPIAVDGTEILVQYGATGMPSLAATSTTGQVYWAPTNTDLPKEEKEWAAVLGAASNQLFMNGAAANLISLMPAYMLSAGLAVQEVPLITNQGTGMYVLQSQVQSLWKQATIGLVGWSNIYQTSSTNSNGNLVGHWPLAYSSGTIHNLQVLDVVAGHNGTITGSTTSQSGLTSSNHAAWHNVDFLKLTGGSVALPNASYNSPAFTVSFLVYLNNLTNTQVLVSYLASATNNSCGWAMTVNSSGGITVYTSDGVTSSYQVFTYAPLVAGQWIHLVLCISNASNIPSYIGINGNCSQLSASTTFYGAPATPAWMYLGANSPLIVIGSTVNLSGAIADFKLWDVPLTQNDSMKEYAAYMTPILGNLPLAGTSSQGIGNSIGAQLLNLGAQGYYAPLDQLLPPLKGLFTTQLTNGAFKITYTTTPPAMQFPLQPKLVRMGTTVVPTLIQALNEGGLEALMRLPMQYLPEQDLSAYYPSQYTELPDSQFMDFDSGFGSYFWELFFYAPYLIAEKLRHNQQFAAAEQWYKYVFDPTAEQHLIDYWPIADVTEASAVRDVIGGMVGTAANLTAETATKLPFALQERAYYGFNGTNGNIVVPYNARLNPPTFSISAWIQLPATQPTTNQTWTTIVCSQTGGSGYQVCINYPSAGYWNLIATIGASGWVVLTSPNLPYDDAWQFLTVTFDGKILRNFVNGIEVAQVALAAGKSFAINNNSTGSKVGNFVIGAGNSGSNSQWYFQGNIANVALWNTALTLGEVANLYNDYKYQRITNRFWNFAPFRRLNAQSLYHILRGDAYESTFVQPPQHYTASLQMAVYEYDPFDPDAIARLRVNSYQKAVFMRYIENLVAWGDALFTQATWESLTDATMHYVLASDLLGKLPVKDVTVAEQTPTSYQDMVTLYGDDKVPSFLIDMEAALVDDGASATIPEQVQSLVNAYFCIPNNTQLLQLWKLVADRLFKLRHGLSLTGQPLDIPLYAPAIDPNALVAAAAAGVSLQVASATPSVPAYRFNYLIQQAKSLAAGTQQLGSELLAALEKQDAEQLAEMQQGYQVTLAHMSIGMKTSLVNQLLQTDQALHASLQSATYLRDTYKRYIKEGLNAEEIIAVASASLALLPMAAAEGVRIAASIAYLFPNTFGLANGGMQFGDSVNMAAASLDGASQIMNSYGQLASTMGQFLRRIDDWKLQENTANYQVQEINAQLRANQFALQAAKQDVAITQTQYAQSQEVLQFLKSKFTNVELYQWMAGQVSGIYFQMYQLSYQMAQLAQVAFQYELNSQQNFLNPSAWNSLYQGLLAGETLSLSLAQMESAFVQNSTRKLNVRKTYSLRQNNPVALLQLLSTGTCHFELDELCYDLDFPGHYNRKIKTLSVSIPAVVGPYQNIHATLVQTHNAVVTKPSVEAVEYLVGQAQTMPLDGSIRSNWNPNQEIIISTGVNDSGVFQVNFDDPQYLPFEGTGAVSGWQLTIPQAANTFNLRSISDVILSVDYTAQDGGITYKNALTSAVTALSNYEGRYFISLRQLFSGAWYNFLSTTQLPFTLVQQMFPQNLDPTSITLGNRNGDVLLFPILAKDLEGTADILPPIMLNGTNHLWDANTFEVAIGDATTVLAGGTNWEITLGAFPTAPPSPLLLPDGKINPAAWLDIALVIPFSGRLDW